MGISLFSNCHTEECSGQHRESWPTPTQPVVPVKVDRNGDPLVDPRNPDPKRFKILDVQEFRGHTAARVNYPNCTNYEGMKILVYECTVNELLKESELDPHFCEGGHLSPIARFEPTDRGWELAKLTVLSLAQ
jgi:hypothetical protein